MPHHGAQKSTTTVPLAVKDFSVAFVAFVGIIQTSFLYLLLQFSTH